MTNFLVGLQYVVTKCYIVLKLSRFNQTYSFMMRYLVLDKDKR